MAQSDSAIGMISLAWMNEDVRGLTIKQGDQLIEPDLETIASGQYPIARELVIVIRDDIQPEAQNFVNFVLSPQGQEFVEQSGYIKIN